MREAYDGGVGVDEFTVGLVQERGGLPNNCTPIPHFAVVLFWKNLEQMRGNMKSPKSGVSDVHGLARRHVSLDSQLTVKATGLGVLLVHHHRHAAGFCPKAKGYVLHQRARLLQESFLRRLNVREADGRRPSYWARQRSHSHLHKRWAGFQALGRFARDCRVRNMLRPPATLRTHCQSRSRLRVHRAEIHPYNRDLGTPP
mmetsp:Transcript_28592/g.54645  ORF Transcript_28592/g.54645 Transcript_28592/m.54645 type:complete len:200 (+) Transcript_28592:1602-2201(+)